MSLEELMPPKGAAAWTHSAGSALRSATGSDTPGKRVLDVTIGGMLIVATLPLMLTIAVVIKLVDGGPVIFWQRRVGRGGREFWFPKFRSMHIGAEHRQHDLRPYNEHGGSITFKIREDPRLTTLGRLLRTLSLDELPQLWCVLTGDMSLVGPRPPLPSEVERYTAHHRRRLDATPGITGLWQVRGRSTVPFEGQVLLDLEYIERRSVALDLAILARTIPAVLSRKGAW